MMLCLCPSETMDVFLAKVKKLAILSEQWMTCALCQDFSHVRQLLQVSSILDEITLSQLRTRTHAIMTEREESDEPVTAATQPTESHDDPHGNV